MILFSIDSPVGDAKLPEKDWVNVFKNPKSSIKFTREDVDIILDKIMRLGREEL